MGQVRVLVPRCVEVCCVPMTTQQANLLDFHGLFLVLGNTSLQYRIIGTHIDYTAAGSFGHHTAKKYALKGRFEPPPEPSNTGDDDHDSRLNEITRRRTMRGLAETRLSVQTLNRLVVTSLIQHGVNAVGMSPCFAVPHLQAHGGGESTIATRQAHAGLERIVRDALEAGLVPVLHGDACLYGKRDAGILSGDVVMERLGLASWVSHAIFLTDVDGVFSSDPRRDSNASLLRHIQIDKDTLDIVQPVLNVSGSSHDHDVTGGLKVSQYSTACSFLLLALELVAALASTVKSIPRVSNIGNFVGHENRQSLLPRLPLQHPEESMSQSPSAVPRVLNKPCFGMMATLRRRLFTRGNDYT